MSTRTKTIVAVAVLLIAASVFAWRRFVTARSGSETTTSAPQAAAQEIYYCPMHPSVTSHEPGNCPICGMALVKRTTSPSVAGAGPAADQALAAISISPEQRVTANVQTTKLTPMTGTGEIVTTGRVTFDERRMAQVTSYTAGRIESLRANFTGDSVRRGEPVATIYSPDLFATQQEYLLARSNRERMRSSGFADARSASNDLVESTRRRLLLSGMTESQVRQLEQTGRPIYNTSIISPVSGIVIRKLVVPQQYVAQGQTLLELADLSTVWVEADVYEQQLPDVRIGQRVEISSPALPGRQLEGRVAFVQPVLAGQTRTATIRVEMANPGLQLKPDMYVSVRILGAPAPPHIMVPATAVIDRGQKQFVWVEVKPNTFEPREVRTGPRHGEAVVIASGLSGGESVVVQGGFLLDSEAQLRGTTAGASGHESH
jgi:Cu(I)/Ag(I) efflux system membrane fusion protein